MFAWPKGERVRLRLALWSLQHRRASHLSTHATVRRLISRVEIARAATHAPVACTSLPSPVVSSCVLAKALEPLQRGRQVWRWTETSVWLSTRATQLRAGAAHQHQHQVDQNASPVLPAFFQKASSATFQPSTVARANGKCVLVKRAAVDSTLHSRWSERRKAGRPHVWDRKGRSDSGRVAGEDAIGLCLPGWPLQTRQRALPTWRLSCSSKPETSSRLGWQKRVARSLLGLASSSFVLSTPLDGWPAGSSKAPNSCSPNSGPSCVRAAGPMHDAETNPINYVYQVTFICPFLRRKVDPFQLPPISITEQEPTPAAPYDSTGHISSANSLVFKGNATVQPLGKHTCLK